MLRFSRRSIFVIFSVVLIAISGPSFTHAALPINEQTIGKQGMDLLKGGCDSDPYAILEKYKSSRNVQLTPKPGTAGNSEVKDGIDSALACRLTKFFAAAEQRGCRPTITSAYRSHAQQASMCGAGRSGCAPAGSSCHQYGLAVDVSGGCVGWMRQAARQFQLTFPYYGDHIQCAEHPGASRRSCNGPCNGGIAITPDLSNIPYFAGGGSTPSSGLAQSLREAFYGPQQQPTLPPQPLPPAQPGTTQPGQYFNQPGQTGTPISIGTAVGGTASGSTSPLLDTSYDAPSDTGSGKPSIADQLLSIAYGTSSAIGTATTTAHAVPLTVNGTDVTQLQSGKHATSMLPESESGVIPLYPQNTFMAQDMSWQKDFSGSASQGQFLAILQELRDSLLKILASLRPMGITNSIEGGPSSAEAYLE